MVRAVGRSRRWELVRSFALAVLVVSRRCPAAAQERYAVLVSGASGGEKYADAAAEMANRACGISHDELCFSDAKSSWFSTSAATGAPKRRPKTSGVCSAISRRRVTREDTVFVVLVGHGTYDGVDAKFNLVGPDLSAADWNSLLDGITGAPRGRQHHGVELSVSRSSSPGPAASSSPRPIPLSSGSPPSFPSTSSDRSPTCRAISTRTDAISIWEAFTVASAGVKQHYEQRGQLPTERPLLDDNGDGVGREADAPGDDGAVARVAVFQRRAATGDAATPTVRRSNGSVSRSRNSSRI